MERLLERIDRVSIVFHWDSDGIAAAAALAREILEAGGGVDLHVPTIGYYTFDAVPKEEIVRYSPNTIVLVDYAIPQGEVDKLKVLAEELVVIDHHVNPLRGVKVVNPVYSIEESEFYPSTTWVLRGELGIGDDLKFLLGVAGDVGARARYLPVWERVHTLLERRGWRWEDILEAARLLDSNYRVGNVEGIKEATGFLADISDGLDEILGNETWRRQLERVEREVRELTSTKPILDVDPILAFHISSSLNVVSPVTRRLARMYPDRIVVVKFESLSGGPCHVYVRSWRYPVGDIIPSLQTRGYSAGGKRDVVGVTTTHEELERAYRDVLEALKKLYLL